MKLGVEAVCFPPIKNLMCNSDRLKSQEADLLFVPESFSHFLPLSHILSDKTITIKHTN